MIDPDHWLVNAVFTPLIRYAGRRFGAEVPGLVRGCAIGYSVFGVMYLVAASYTLAVIVAGGFWLIFVSSWIGLVIARQAERWPNSIYRSDKPLRYTYLVTLVVIASLAAFSWIPGVAKKHDDAGLFMTLAWVMYTAAHYFAACPPAPPRRPRVPALAAPVGASS